MGSLVAHLEFEKPILELERRIEDLRSMAGADHGIRDQLAELQGRVRRLQSDIYADLTVWQKVQLSRHPDRPYFRDYLERIFDDFVELHGDRSYRDDPAIVAGFARFGGKSVAVIGQQKGRTTKEKVHRNFAMAHPEGYRKACRIMELAGRFGRPVLTFIDTPGAYPGLGAEERGQAEAIGQALLTMSRLPVPVLATVLGEGGSGGALALGVANRLLMLEYATFSVISPEGCASILWRDGAKAADAASQLKPLAADAVRLGIADAMVDEPLGGAHRDADGAAERLSAALAAHLRELQERTPSQLVADRYDKYRAMGAFEERASESSVS
jgi:acetyl-CoA carboxylase carboxyl transferase subunit alpha